MTQRTSILIAAFIVVAVIAVIIFNQSTEPMQDQETNQPQEQMPTERQPLEQGEVGIEILQEGSGAEAKETDRVAVHYTGMLEDGSTFDSSIPRGTPFEFTLGARQVILGWEQGVKGMKVGEKRKLTIPSDLGYGPGGFPPVIPPNATLIFEVELLEIK